MAGVKGRSGRRINKDERKHRAILDKAWDIVEKYLNDENIELRLRAEMAAKLCAKDIPQDVSVSQNVVQMPVIEVKGNLLTYDIGTPVQEGEINDDTAETTGDAGEVVSDSTEAQ